MKVKALKAAFPSTIPVLTGYTFLGLAYGIYMNAAGFPFVYPFIISLLLFGGSLQFLAVAMLLSPFAPLQVFIMSLLVQARHIFYGISMLEKYKGLGWKRFYLIFALSDETFSVNYSSVVPEGIDRGWYYFFVALLDQSYWVIASLLGGILGGVLSLNIQGIDFVMTAMFVTIFTEQWLKEKHHISATIGLFGSLVCLIIFKADSFLIPTMILIIVALFALKKPVEAMEAKK